MKDGFEMYGDGMKPVKSTGTCWIDHLIHAMQRLVDKYGLYCQHLQHTIPEIKKTKDCAIIRGKFDKLINVKVLLRSCIFVDALSTTKQFSLTTQKFNIDINSVVDNVESIKTAMRSFQENLNTMQIKFYNCPHSDL